MTTTIHTLNEYGEHPFVCHHCNKHVTAYGNGASRRTYCSRTCYKKATQNKRARKGYTQ